MVENEEPVSKPKLFKWLAIISGSVLMLALVGAFSMKALAFYDGPLYDEWICSEGESPVMMAEGGSYCLKAGETPDAGSRLDPLGNRPFDCQNRAGWRAISDGREYDCLKDDTELPKGYEHWDIKPREGFFGMGSKDGSDNTD